uniref:receptor-like protein 9DC3 n=1 Tax=Erigeron canadensis TaxID=72917 RepID=UPI001CB964DF|nr:receptor-like protein 9DC3 [Erigeron canadensis]
MVKQLGMKPEGVYHRLNQRLKASHQVMNPLLVFPCLVALNPGLRISIVAAGGRHTLALSVSDIGQDLYWLAGRGLRIGLLLEIRFWRGPVYRDSYDERQIVFKEPHVNKNRGALEGLILNENQFEGEVPSSLSKCQSLKVVDIGNNHLNGTFPHWLESLPNLQVLVLKSNRFHGQIVPSSTVGLRFPTLQVIDLSHNGFEGQLPIIYFQNFNAMKNVVNKSTPAKYLSVGRQFYSFVVTIKGVEQVFTQLYVSYTIICISHNNFVGEIPDILGNLSSLVVLDLSHNSLTGQIPHTLGKLSEIESLDLSCNQLIGKIPQSLADLMFIEFLNLSQNHLVGVIPVGNQLKTFQEDSFDGNPNLCGVPLPKKCNDNLHDPQLEGDHGDDDEDSGFTWRVVMLGYGCGALFGYLMLSTRRPLWFNAIADALEQMILKRRNKKRYVYIGK